MPNICMYRAMYFFMALFGFYEEILGHGQKGFMHCPSVPFKEHICWALVSSVEYAIYILVLYTV